MDRKAKVKKPLRRSKRKAPVQVTGGGGFRFENPVAARFLLDMLIGKNSLGADFGRVVGLHWQVRDAGWLADDLAVFCRTTSGEERAAGLSVKTYQQLGRNGFHSDFSTIAWQQALNQKTGRNFKCGVDAIALATGDLADDVATAWSDLRTQAVQSTPERVVARLKADKDDGPQASKLQRAIFESLRRPDAGGGDQRDEDAHDRILLIRDILVIKFDYEVEPSSDYTQALLDCQNCLSSGDAAEALKLWERLVASRMKSARPADRSIFRACSRCCEGSSNLLRIQTFAAIGRP
jgi:hypothetical protein